MKSLLIALSILSSLAASAATSLPVPAGYKAILDCPASRKSPALVVAVKGEDYFLAAKVSNKVELFLLENVDADMGYVGYAPVKDISATVKNLDAIYVMNNEEDLEDYTKAVVTRGQVHVEGKGTVQECNAVGKFLVYKK